MKPVLVLGGAGYAGSLIGASLLDPSAVAQAQMRCGPRRSGNPAGLIASAQKARDVLGCLARHSSSESIVASALAWRLWDRA